MPSKATPYAIALAAIAVAIGVRWLTAPWLEDRLPYGPLYAAVAVAAWVGGWRPGAFATVVGLLATEIVFNGRGLRMSVPYDISLTLLLYGASCGIIVYFADAHRRALLESSALARALSAKLREHEETSMRLHAAEARFRDSHDASLQGYAMLTALRDATGNVADFTFDYINPAGAAMAGGAAEHFIGRRMAETYPAAWAVLLERLREVFITGKAADFELLYQDGPMPGRFRNMAVKAGHGVALAFIALGEPDEMQPERAAFSR